MYFDDPDKIPVNLDDPCNAEIPGKNARIQQNAKFPSKLGTGRNSLSIPRYYNTSVCHIMGLLGIAVTFLKDTSEYYAVRALECAQPSSSLRSQW